MRTIILGDQHIGNIQGCGRQNGSGGNTRIDDYERSLNFVVDYAIKTKADIFISTGDVFETRSPTTEHIQIVDRAIKRLSDSGIFTIFIMGNHDYKKTGETFTSALATMQANSYQNVRILLEPDIITYSNKAGDHQAMILLPYRDRRMYGGTTIKEATDAYNKHIVSLVSRVDKYSATIAVGHNFFFDGNYFDFGGHEVLASPDSFIGIDAVVMGHYHTAKVIRKANPIAHYCGSMERTNFGDADVMKFFSVFDSETKTFQQVKIPVRDLLDIVLDLSASTAFTYLADYKQQIADHDFQDKICRIKIRVKDGMQNQLSRPDLERLLYDAGAYYVSKISWDVERIRLEKDKDILSNKTDFEIFKAFAKTQDVEAGFLQKILEEARKIMGDDIVTI